MHLLRQEGRGVRGSSGTRRGAGALLAVSIIGVGVVATMLLGQGFLSGALSLTDAARAGRQAEYLADAALAEAYHLLQVGRNDVHQAMFMGGGGTTIAPERTRARAADGVTVYDVDVVIDTANDFHGDGRGYHGTVTLTASAAVPRRVARLLGTSAYRTTRHTYEYKAVQQGPPAAFADMMLYLSRLDGLPEVERWYHEEVRDPWDEIREDAEETLIDEVEDLADRLEKFRRFSRDARDLLQEVRDWPGNLTAIGGQSPWFHDFDPDSELVPIGKLAGLCDAVGTLQIIDVNIYAQKDGDLRWKCDGAAVSAAAAVAGVVGVGSGSADGWKEGHPAVPSAASVLEEVIDRALHHGPPGIGVIPEYWQQAGHVDVALARLDEIGAADTGAVKALVEATPLLKERAVDGDAAAGDWPRFREDGITGGALGTRPAHVAASHGSVESKELLLEPPNRPSPFLDSPLVELKDYRDFDIQEFYELFEQDFAPIETAVKDFQEDWEKFLEDWNGVTYLADWEEELRRYEELIALDATPEEGPLARAYWDRMAAYRFPSVGEGLDYIQSRWGEAGAVYSFAGGGGLDLGIPGDATFVGADDGVSFAVSGAGAGAKNVAARNISVAGSARGALLSPDSPVRFDGGSVEGIVCADGLYNDGSTELDPFRITHDAFADAGITVSISESPLAVTLDRGAP